VLGGDLRDDLPALDAVLVQEPSRRSDDLDGFARERGGFRLRLRDESHRAALRHRVRLRGGVHLVRHRAFPTRVAVDVVPQHAS
jgi:hypothetical protein